MNDWDEHQRQFIGKLDDADKLFDEIFKKDASGLIINGEDRQALSELRQRNSAILNKLKSKEFTVALVGLENSGKSTLGNALIKAIVLPEYRERCTYTTTELRAGDSDIAVVSFYTQAEFNDRFKKMFEAIEYPGEVNFATMTLGTFNNYWQKIAATNQALYNLHNGKIAADIKEILEGKQDVSALLGQPDKTFTRDKWTDRAFSIFITGIFDEIKNEKGEVTKVIRKSHPYAVKNVVIYSKQLGDMKNIVLYDVPGFDSPTKLHREQTVEMLKKADAFILVTNVASNPRLTGPQLDVLQSNADDFGVNLNEKAFVFGTQLDRLGDPKTAVSNMNTLCNDAEGFGIASEKNVIGGSARAYLEALGFYDGDLIAKQTCDDWKMPYGVDELYTRMQNYYDHERYAVLKRKAEGTLKDTREFLKELLAKYPPDMLMRLENGGEYLLKLKDRLRLFIEQSNELIKKRLQDIHDKEPFSVALVDNIEKIYPLIEDAYEELVKKIENSLVIDPDDVYPTTTVNGILRQRLQVEFIKNIVTEVARLTEGRQAEIRAELVENFLLNMEMQPHSQYRAELEQSVNKLFDELMIDGGAQCYFNPLVERFTTTLMEALILSPFAEEERFKKIRINLPEFISLAVYYNATSDKLDESKLEISDSTDERIEFFAQLLTHGGVEESEPQPSPAPPQNVFDDRPSVSLAENLKLLKSFFASTNVDEQYLKKWSKQLADAKIKFEGNVPNRFQRKVTDGTRTQNVDWNNPAQRTRLFDDIIGEICREMASTTSRRPPSDPPAYQSIDKGSSDQLKELHELGKKLKTMRSKEEMIATLNADIEILRDITVKAVIKAIGLERAFISVISKNANLIRTSLDEKPEGQEKLNLWIRNNVHKLKEAEFMEIDRKNENSETRRQIVKAVQEVLKKM